MGGHFPSKKCHCRFFVIKTVYFCHIFWKERFKRGKGGASPIQKMSLQIYVNKAYLHISAKSAMKNSNCLQYQSDFVFITLIFQFSKFPPKNKSVKFSTSKKGPRDNLAPLADNLASQCKSGQFGTRTIWQTTPLPWARRAQRHPPTYLHSPQLLAWYIQY